MDIALHIFIILICFTIAFFGVVVLFTVDVWTGLALSTSGILLAIKSIERA
jgi:hypothetical protein